MNGSAPAELMNEIGTVSPEGDHKMSGTANMANAVGQEINLRLQNLDQAYHHLLILVGPSSSGKTSALTRLAQANEWPFVNVNLALSTKLLELSKRRSSCIGGDVRHLRPHGRTTHRLSLRAAAV